MKKQIAFLAFAALATSCGNGQTPVSSIGGASVEATPELSSGLDPDYAIPSDDEIAGKDSRRQKDLLAWKLSYLWRFLGWGFDGGIPWQESRPH